MIINDDVIASIDENLVDISSGWLWADVDVYSPDYTSKLAQPISVESSTLNELRFLTSAGNIVIRNDKRSRSRVLWAGYIEFINDPTEISINQKLDTSALNFSMSTGIILKDIPDLIRYTDGFIVPGFDISIYPTSDFRQTIEQHTITSASFSIARDGVSNYVVVDYNNGNPYLKIEQNTSNINQSNIVAVYVVWNVDGNIHAIGFDNKGEGLSNKIDSMIIRTEPYKRSIDGGLSISNSGFNILLTSAVVYAGTTPYQIYSYNSSIDYITKCYHTAGNWTYIRTSGSSVDNIYYDNGTNLVSANNNKYLVRWLYRSIGDDKEVFLVYGTNQYNTLALAQLEAMPTVPGIVQSHCMLVGRFIVQQGSSSVIAESAFTQQFSTGTVGNHNDLNNIQGGNPTNSEYYHLSASTYGYLQSVSADVQTQINDMDNKFQVFADGTYLRLDASNSPITNTLRMNGDIIMSSASGGKRIIFQDEAASPGTSAYIATGLGSDYPFALRVMHSSAAQQTALHVMSPNNNTSATRIEALVPTLATNISAINFSDITYSGNKVLVSNSNFIKESSVTTTELGYLTGTSDNIQTQFNKLKMSGTARWIEDFRVSGANDQTMFQSAANYVSANPGTRLYLTNRATYVLTSAVTFPSSFELDGNNATISGTYSLLVSQKIKATYSSGSYFTTSAGQAIFECPSGVTISAGDVIRLMSNTIRLGTSYTYGQLVKCISRTGTTVVLDTAFLFDFMVDTIRVYEGNDVYIHDVTFDNTITNIEYSRSPAKSLDIVGDRVIIERCNFLGSLEAGYGVLAQGMFVRIIDSYARGYLNYHGIYSGGRIGYGFGAAGDDCAVIRCRGERNKHDVDFHLREYVTRIGRISQGSYFSPKAQAGTLTPTLLDGSNPQPLYQYRIGAHANCLDLIIEDVEVDHCNGAIGVRGGRAIISNCIFRARDNTTSFGQNNIVVIEDTPMTDIKMSNCQVFIDDTPSNKYYIIGGMADVDGVHKNLTVKDCYVSGCGLLQLIGYSDTHRANLENVVFDNINGSICTGIIIGENSSNTIVEYAKNIQIKNSNLVYTSATGSYRELITISEVVSASNISINNSNIDISTSTIARPVVKLTTSGTLSGIDISNNNITSVYGITYISATNFIDNLNINNNRFFDNNQIVNKSSIDIDTNYIGSFNIDGNIGNSNFGVIEMRPISGVSATITNNSISNNNFTYHNNTDTSSFGPGIYVSTPGIPTLPWKICDNVINATVSANQSECIRFGNQSNLILNNNTINTNWRIGSPSRSWKIPTGNKSFSDKYLPWVSTEYVDNIGNIYQSTKPTTNSYPVGTVIYNLSAASTGDISWVYTSAGTWRNVNPIDYTLLNSTSASISAATTIPTSGVTVYTSTIDWSNITKYTIKCKMSQGYPDSTSAYMYAGANLIGSSVLTTTLAFNNGEIVFTFDTEKISTTYYIFGEITSTQANPANIYYYSNSNPSTLSIQLKSSNGTVVYVVREYKQIY